MRFEIVRDPAKIARIRKRLAERDRRLMVSRGPLIRHEMPALPEAFPRLGRVLEESAYLARFAGTHYHIASRDGRIERLLPAAEYYKFVFRAVADKRYVLEFGLDRLRELERWIQRYYGDIREPMLRTEEPSLRVVDKVYALKSELGNILFVVRGTLGTVATLMHFLYGPGAPHFTTFAAFITYLNRRPSAGAAPDQAMRDYIEEQMGWFRMLREYHDYVTHYGSIDISFYEPREGVLRTYLQDASQVHDVVAPVLAGLDSFFEFVDGHFSARITASA